jgi:uncharacterized protein (DUF1684 family)
MFKAHPYSPLTPKQRQNFTGLRYFDPHPALDLTVEAEEFAYKETVTLQTTSGDTQTFFKWGKFSFRVGAETAELTLFFSPASSYFFLPFMDATNGTESYSGGRYLEPEWLGGSKFHIDFNLAYSPYCAYNADWSCPIPPLENRLQVPIEAGEKAFDY